VAWSIQHAREAHLVDRVVVSTDGEEIAAEAKRWGADVPFMRPASISGDRASTELAMIHAVETLADSGYHPDLVVLLQATSPVRLAGAVDRAIRQLIESGADSLVSATEIHPFLWRNPDNCEAMYDFRRRPMRQDIPENERLYEENGSIYIVRTEILLRDKCRLGGKIVIFPMSSKEKVDLDTLDDFAAAESVLRRLSANDH
jgi:N-acylneuraminate cytidylyltransferase